MNNASDTLAQTTDIREVHILETPIRTDTATARYAGYVEIALDRSWANIYLNPNPRSSDMAKLSTLIHRDDLSRWAPVDGVYTLMVDYPMGCYEGDDIILCTNDDCTGLWHAASREDPDLYLHTALLEGSDAETWTASVEATPGHPWAICAHLEDDVTPEAAIEFAAAIIRASDLASELNTKGH